jgi:hypothetical protein
MLAALSAAAGSVELRPRGRDPLPAGPGRGSHLELFGVCGLFPSCRQLVSVISTL